MSPDELESVAKVLSPIDVDDRWPVDARASARLFNVRIAGERELLEDARAAVAEGRPIPRDVLVVLRAIPSLYEAERARLAQRLPRVNGRGEYWRSNSRSSRQTR